MSEHLSGVLVEIGRPTGFSQVVTIWPYGSRHVGQDGRVWTVADPAALAADINRSGALIPIDFEGGGEAAGVVRRLDVFGQSLVGFVEWNATGYAALAGGSYRYFSPEFLYRMGQDGRVIEGLVSLSLVHPCRFDGRVANRATGRATARRS